MQKLKITPSDKALKLESFLEDSVVGQTRAIKNIVQAFERVWAGLNAPDRPLANLMFLGPTGVGKTETARALAKYLHGSKNEMLRIDCAEFQHSHEVAKLIGAPPGYLGHRETGARLSQANVNKYQSAGNAVTIFLIDEIEKAAPEFFDILLGLLSTGSIAMGDGSLTSFTKTIVIMTSNLSSKETQALIHNSGLGFHSGDEDRAHLDDQIWKITKESVRKFFRPEFVNRIDKFIGFQSLSAKNLKDILNLQISEIQERLFRTNRNVLISLSDSAKNFIIKAGTSEASGARELNRVLETDIVTSLASILSGSEIQPGDSIVISTERGKLTFYREAILKK